MKIKFIINPRAGKGDVQRGSNGARKEYKINTLASALKVLVLNRKIHARKS